ncbi:serine protease [Chromobacterium sinusclupearum]|uniref:Serine protease n=1 Tax=Chromobacterium sinusclupearum TaxID=2077146 RepID=A0A2K4MU48_9NEIS|nr:MULTISPECIES: S8 family peptidase [Chromobacterium]POB00296.1 serine protease [Chromobacterium sinusclupearum]
MHHLISGLLLAGLGITAAQAAPNGPAVAGIIVKYKQNSQAQLARQAASLPRGQALAARPADFAQRTQQVQQITGLPLRFDHQMGTGAYVFNSSQKLSAGQAQELAKRIKQQDPTVEYAEPNFIKRANFVPSSPLYGSQQWDMQDSASQPGSLNLPAAWDITQGKGVTVAVLDTGYRPHKDLTANLLQPGYNFVSDPASARLAVGPDGRTARQANALDQGDWAAAGDCGPGTDASPSSWHGTHVAGTIAAAAGNGQGLTGVAPQAKLLPLRVLGRCGGTDADIADAMLWAVGGAIPGLPANTTPARVISMSLGGAQPCTQTYRDVLQQVSAHNGIVVVAAGNATRNTRDFAPASCPGVITVAANGKSGGIASYSNYGALTAVTAPGGDQGVDPGIYSTLNDGKTAPGNDIYAAYQGTSMATPHVAGLVALMLSVNPNLDWKAARKLLVQTARLPAASCEGCSAGLVDAAAAVKAAQAYR